MNEFEALTNLANGPIIFTHYAESELSISTLQYINAHVVFRRWRLLLFPFIYKKYCFAKLFVYTKSKKINPVYVQIYGFKPKYWELSWAIKMKSFILEKSQWFNNQKTVRKFTKQP